MACSLIGSSIVTTTQNGLLKLQGFAEDAVTEVESISKALTGLVKELTPITKDIKLDASGELSDQFDVGFFPTLKNPAFGGPTIGNKETVSVDDFTNTAKKPGDAPSGPPTLDFSGAPTDPDITDPGSGPPVGSYTFPNDPTQKIPGLPKLETVVIPKYIPLKFPSFDSIEPTKPKDYSFGKFDWTETNYSGEVDVEVVEQIKAILGGSTGIPTLIWDMIASRARKQIRVTANQAREEATDFWASRGHFLTTGQERKRIKEAGDKEAEGVSEIIRELLIQDAKIYVDRLNNALAQGIAYEGQLIGLHNQMAEREYQAKIMVFEIAFKVAEFDFNRYNTEMQGYLINAQVYQTIIQSEIAKLEEVKIDLELEKLKSTINMQTLETYKMQIAGIVATYDVFKSSVEAVAKKYEADKIRVEAFAEEVKIFETRYKAFEIEWRAYAEKIKSQVAIMEGYKVEGDAFSSRVSAYAAGIQADKAESDAKVNIGRIEIDEIRANLDRLQLLMTKEKDRVSALQANDKNKIEKFNSGVRAEQARISADAQRLGALTADANMLLQSRLQQIQLDITDTHNILTSQTNAFNNTLQAQASVGSSAFTALNYAATISDQVANTHACNNTYVI